MVGRAVLQSRTCVRLVCRSSGRCQSGVDLGAVGVWLGLPELGRRRGQWLSDAAGMMGACCSQTWPRPRPRWRRRRPADEDRAAGRVADGAGRRRRSARDRGRRGLPRRRDAPAPDRRRLGEPARPAVAGRVAVAHGRRGGSPACGAGRGGRGRLAGPAPGAGAGPVRRADRRRAADARRDHLRRAPPGSAGRAAGRRDRRPRRRCRRHRCGGRCCSPAT